MGIDIVVLVPVYQRPHRVLPLMRTFEKSRPERTHLLFVASPEDRAQLDALEGTRHLVVPFRQGRGDWAKKINYAYRHTSQSWMLLAADDIVFHRGWDKALRQAMRSGKRVLGTNDLNPNHNPENIYSPHPLVARSYVDEWGTVDRKRQVVCEEYHHNYPDRELAATAIARDQWLFVEDAVIEHKHPGWTDTANDDTYRLGSRFAVRDYNLHVRRGRLWYREKKIRERALLNANHPR